MVDKFIYVSFWRFYFLLIIGEKNYVICLYGFCIFLYVVIFIFCKNKWYFLCVIYIYMVFFVNFIVMYSFFYFILIL